MFSAKYKINSKNYMCEGFRLSIEQNKVECTFNREKKNTIKFKDEKYLCEWKKNRIT